MDPLLNSTRNKMQKTMDVVRQDFSTVRSGKASPTLVENVVINAYNGTQKLKVMELATTHIQDPHMLVVTPFDQSIIGEIEKGIASASVGLSPIVDGNILRISLPPLTEERRKEFVKLINQKAESGKIMIRHIRHEAMEEIKKRGEHGTSSEDEVIRLEKETQKLTDEFIENIDMLRDEKEEELMKI